MDLRENFAEFYGGEHYSINELEVYISHSPDHDSLDEADRCDGPYMTNDSGNAQSAL